MGMERPLLPQRPQRTTFLICATFFCSFLGALSHLVQLPPVQVFGTLRKSILLSVNNISVSEKLITVEWDFQPQNGKRLIIAEIREGKRERPNPKDRFGPRLELENETTLRIRNLEEEDSGTYWARVRFHPVKIQLHTFDLMVYNPVPEPWILLFQEASNSSSKCNVTLRCLVSEKGGLNVSWRIGDAIEPLEGGLDWHQLSSEGWSLHLSNLSNPMDSRVTCLVSNPADRKSASIDLTGTCSFQGGRERHLWLVFPIVTMIAIVFALAAGFWIWKKRKEQPHTEGTLGL
ncbi:uncharacterized protein LOC121916175 [Sceloporus undulatus]|uniref:uncharacterized protein LOC121916175 n=1 Tax=Sceloporus undulatus TaxID=8520 RepID=UPI001C4B82BB|nr:uncharacterized protein LOC121916175 [Sceloporus undulatus]